MVNFDHVTMVYPGSNKLLDNKALDDVSFRIRPGEFVFVVGASGSGKSTLIKLILKELTATEGTVTVMNNDLSTVRAKGMPLIRRQMGVVFQDFRLLKDKNVYENVAFAMQIVEAPKKEIDIRVHELLSMVGLGNKESSYPDELSGGEQQRVALARAMANRPKIILADEPTGNLDVKNANDIMRMLERENSRGTTVIVVTHNLDIVRDMNKRVITINHGIITSDKGEGEYEF
ncbi:MAG: cell division ATP-binding protein FtsE [Lachnospiraceae bacterium]|nr:cell division ATP-binding protein FtsE [Lachnospiraceae bacterium]